MERLIQDRRIAKGLTVAQLAKKIGVARKTVYCWEKGTSSPTADNLREISKVLNISANTLLNAQD